MTASRESYTLPPPALDWDSAGLPYSTDYADRYYSADGAAAEAEHVFLRGNDLPQAWHGRRQFVIAELGFGAGLNFLLTARLWCESKPPDGRLHYVSIESRPLAAADLRRVLMPLSSSQQDVEQLIASLPFPFEGTHSIRIRRDVTLQLCYGDVEPALEGLAARVDAWFLDGFSPAKNPRMWSERVCCDIARLSNPGATLATYSAAGGLRRLLEVQGFAVEKRPGFGRKREMLTAVLGGRLQDRPRPRRAVIVGGGLAGAACAYSFRERGINVTLIEQEQSVAARASGNAVGVVMPHLSAAPDLMSRFYLLCYEHTRRMLGRLHDAGREISGAECGVLRVASSERLEKVLESLPRLGLPAAFVEGLSREEAIRRIGFDVSAGGLFFPGGGWVNPPDLCRALLESGVELRLAERACGIEPADDEVIVYCGGYESDQFERLNWFPLEKVRGQVTSARATERSSRLEHVLCYDGYIAPALGGSHFLGATYDHENDSTEASAEQNQDLFARLAEWAPGIGLSWRGGEPSRVSFRTMSRDRMPLCGPVPDLAALAELGEPLFRRGWEDGALVPGLYASVGHGSRGVISSMLAAEVIAAHACGEPLPLERELLRAVYPARFPVRLLLQGKTLDRENLDSLKVPHLRQIIPTSAV